MCLAELSTVFVAHLTEPEETFIESFEYLDAPYIYNKHDFYGCFSGTFVCTSTT